MLRSGIEGGGLPEEREDKSRRYTAPDHCVGGPATFTTRRGRHRQRPTPYGLGRTSHLPKNASNTTDAASRRTSPASVRGVEFSRELRNDVLAGDITLSVRLWKRPRVRQGGRYRVGLGEIEVDAIELVPFAAVTAQDVRRAGEPDRETLRRRAAHAGPIDEDTLVYRVEFHAVSPPD